MKQRKQSAHRLDADLFFIGLRGSLYHCYLYIYRLMMLGFITLDVGFRIYVPKIDQILRGVVW